MLKMRFSILLLFLPFIHSTVYFVGPTRTYTTFTSTLLNALAPGDRVEVDYATYTGGIKFVKAGTIAQPITILGKKNPSGNRPVFSGGVNTIQFEGSHNLQFISIEVTGGSSRCVYHRANNILIQDLKMHHCPLQGLLGSDTQSGNLTLEYSEIYSCGQGTQSHQIYMATNENDFPGSVFRMRYNYVHDGVGGNNVKSRAERNEIYFNWIEGALYHELELIGPDPAGGVAEDKAREDSDVIGNVLRKTNTNFVARLGGDGTGQSKGRYRFVNNTIIMNSGGSAAFRLYDGLESLEAHHNLIYGAGAGSKIIRTTEAVWTAGVRIAGQNNWVRADYLNSPPSSSITGWTGTVKTTNTPNFVNLASFDFRLGTGSNAIHAGSPGPLVGPPGSPYLYPFPTTFYYPKRGVQAIGSAVKRCESPGNPSIGAFIAASDTTVCP